MFATMGFLVWQILGVAKSQIEIFKKNPLLESLQI